MIYVFRSINRWDESAEECRRECHPKMHLIQVHGKENGIRVYESLRPPSCIFHIVVGIKVGGMHISVFAR